MTIQKNSSKTERLVYLIENSTDWIIDQLYYYVNDLGYAKYTSTLREAWRISIEGLSKPMITALKKSGNIPNFGPDEDFSEDPIASFGILEAQRHRSRGISLVMFLGLTKYYKQSYIDLIINAHFEKEYEDYCRLFINRFFDRVELSFCEEWLKNPSDLLIKELQKKNRELTNEKNKYLTIFESLPNPVIYLNSGNEVENINNAGSTLFHFSTIPGAFYYNEQKDRKLGSFFLSELEEFKSSNESEFAYKKKIMHNREAKIFQINFKRMLDMTSKFQGIIVILNDLTEHKKAERKLKESENKLRKFMDSATDGIIIFDSKLNYIDVNNITLQTADMTREELIGKNILDIAPDLKETGRYDKYLDVIKTGKPFSTEDVIFNRKDRSLNSFFSTRAFKVGNELGIIFTDITESKKKEQEIRLQSEIMTNMSEGVYLVRAETGEIVYTNPAFEKIFGYNPDEMIGRDVSIVNAPNNKSPKEIKDEIIRILMETGEWHGEVKNIKKDGTYFWCYANVTLFDHPEYGRVLISIHTDISERKKKEDELRLQSEIMTNMAEGVHLIRLEDLKIIYSNPRFDEMIGYEPGELIGKDVAIINAPTEETPEEKKQNILGILRETGEWHGEVINIKKDGTPFWCYANVSLFDHHEFGRVSISVHTDITERKKKEEEIRLHSEIMTNMSEGVYLIRLEDLIIVYVNPRFEQMFGYESGEMIGKYVVIVNAPTEKTPEETKNEIVGILQETGEWHGEVQNIKKDGTLFWCYSNVSLFDHPEYGKVIVSVHTDITERKKREEILKESERKLKEAQALGKIGYWEFDITNQQITWSDQIFKIYNRDPSLGPPSEEEEAHYYTPDTNKRLKEYARRAIEFGEEFDYDLQANLPSGMVVHLSALMRTIKNRSGQVIKLAGTVQDITERKEKEKEIEEDLKEINQLKSEFLRRASHELKTPLISIKGFSDLILALYEDQLDPVIISKLREINDGCERLQNIINNLLKTSRLESTEIKPKVQKENLSFLINFCVHELQALAEGRKQSIKLDIHDNLFVNMEKEEIHDVLSNLLTNAIKYTPPKGKIEVKTELNKDFVVVSVSDNGIGFTEGQKKMIFQQFGKIERYGKGLDLGIDGTGLGLYISKRIVESHGGQIWMESEGENKGASFYFTVPTFK